MKEDHASGRSASSRDNARSRGQMVYEAGGETLLTYVQPSPVLTAVGVADTARKLDQGLAHLTNVAGS
jgi:hypothetical protein